MMEPSLYYATYAPFFLRATVLWAAKRPSVHLSSGVCPVRVRSIGEGITQSEPTIMDTAAATGGEQSQWRHERPDPSR